MTPLSIAFGPWLPDINNVAVKVSYLNVVDVPLADCNNIYYADGDYKSLPTPSPVYDVALANTLGATTAIGPGGNPYLLLGTSGGVLYAWNGTTWAAVSAATADPALAWRFAQFGENVYSVAGNLRGRSLPIQTPVGTTTFTGWGSSGQRSLMGANVTGSISGTVLTVNAYGSTDYGSIAVGMGVQGSTQDQGLAPDQNLVYITSFGTGTGGAGTYNLSGTALGTIASARFFIGAAPTARVIATVGQFLTFGDILQYNQNYQIGTGGGGVTTFSGILPLVGVVPGTVYVRVDTTTYGPDNGQGAFSVSGMTGTINYATGAISVTFATAPGVALGIFVNYTNEWMARWYWSGIDAPTLWPVPLTNAAIAVQSSFQDMDQSQGPIMFTAGYPLYAVIFQRGGITRASYVGGDSVWGFQNFEQKRGLLTSGAACQVDQLTFFLSDEGFFVTDGASVIPIGTASDNSAGIDNWFKTNVNKAALSAISSAYDATLRCVTWAIPTGSNTSPDTLLIYNPRASRWTKAAIASTLIWTDSDGSFHRLGLIDQSGKYNLLTGTPAVGYAECCDVQFADSMVRYVSGIRPNMACSDTPTGMIGTRLSQSSGVTYSAANAPDAFSKLITFIPQDAIFARFRLSSAAASAIKGGTLMLETGGEV